MAWRRWHSGRDRRVWRHRDISAEIGLSPMKTIALETSSQPGAWRCSRAPKSFTKRGCRSIVARRRPLRFSCETRCGTSAGVRPTWDSSRCVKGPGHSPGCASASRPPRPLPMRPVANWSPSTRWQVIAHQAAVDGEPVWAVLDAQRQQLFVAGLSGTARAVRWKSPPRRSWMPGRGLVVAGRRRWSPARGFALAMPDPRPGHGRAGRPQWNVHAGIAGPIGRAAAGGGADGGPMEVGAALLSPERGGRKA